MWDYGGNSHIIRSYCITRSHLLNQKHAHHVPRQKMRGTLETACAHFWSCQQRSIRRTPRRARVPKHFDAGRQAQAPGRQVARKAPPIAGKELVDATRQWPPIQFWLDIILDRSLANLAYLRSFDTTMARGHAAVFHQILARSVGRSVGGAS